MAPEQAAAADTPVTVLANVSIPRPRTSTASGEATGTEGFPQGFRARRGTTVRVTKEQGAHLIDKGYARPAAKDEKPSEEDTTGTKLQRSPSVDTGKGGEKGKQPDKGGKKE